MKLAYLVNQYPKVSHAFIRREVLALEALGTPVDRFSVRPARDLVDPDDLAEAAKTEAILGRGAWPFARAVWGALLRRPRAFLTALAAAVRLGRRSERGVAYHLVYLAEAAWLQRELALRGITHLHAHFGTNSTTVALLCRLLGGPPYSFTVHGPEEFDKPEAISLGDKVAHAHGVVAISSFGRSQIYRWSRYRDWGKVQVARCAVDEGWLTLEPAPLPPSSRRLVCVGRLCEQKGQALLVEAAARLARSGSHFELVLVGDGELRREVERLIAELGLQERVSITGWADSAEIRRQLAAARALVLPSFAEGLPVVIMEAFAASRPVISTRIAGIPELVEDGVNGWLIPAGDTNALEEAMREALDTDCEQLERMGRAGRAVVAERHRARSEARTLLRLFTDGPRREPEPLAVEVDA